VAAPVAQPPAPVPAATTAPAPAMPVAPAPAAPGGPNAAPLDLFPQGMPGLGGGAGAGALDFLRNNPQVSHFLCGVTEDSVAAPTFQFATGQHSN
jgi:hypothetical protein